MKNSYLQELEAQLKDTEEALMARAREVYELRALLRSTEWLGCLECDITFDCYDGEQRCIRLPAKKD